MLDRHIIGSLFIDGTLTGEKYPEMLHDPISERLEELEPDYVLFTTSKMGVRHITTTRQKNFCGTRSPDV